MRNQLREAVEELRQFYIQKLRDAGVLHEIEKETSLLTLSELENMYKFYQL
ncbi:Fur-regulated basic protein FbpA [Virgibacillus ndiopensis]|uniref:Fur-regulated basic protein FbpA n=1 Tax=Virgibacillus ndiopensis TaxID=2004408 RepID=UPI000C072F5D|nr:Fur-regulated basic protein FbpA [Virgibacillus ndiopensis]